jgi:hypothetical protein
MRAPRIRTVQKYAKAPLGLGALVVALSAASAAVSALRERGSRS